MKSCALIVGINDYPKSPLRGAVKDAENIEKLLSENGDKSKNFFCRLITSKTASVTLSRLRSELIRLFNEDADKVLFYFSGHGFENSLGGYLVTQDARSYAEGLAISELMLLANEALEKRKVREVILILDCCYSGHLGNVVKYNHMQSVMMPGLTILTASSEKQFSLEDSKGGVFTNLLCEGLNGAAADIRGRISTASLYNYLDQVLGAWEQRPQFKTHSRSMSLLRTVPPKVTIEDFAQLKEYFESSGSRLFLDPTWEVTVVGKDHPNVKKFNQLKKYRDAGLIKVDEKNVDLYWAAMNKGYVELTFQGRQYWKMVDKKII